MLSNAERQQENSSEVYWETFRNTKSALLIKLYNSGKSGSASNVIASLRCTGCGGSCVRILYHNYSRYLYRPKTPFHQTIYIDLSWLIEFLHPIWLLQVPKAQSNIFLKWTFLNVLSGLDSSRERKSIYPT